MARGNQRDQARLANQKKQSGQKPKNTMSGAETQRANEDAAEKMRAKQAAADAKKLAEQNSGASGTSKIKKTDPLSLK